jgi:2-polyprenyl-3-methyl-5-hydroxy-6-metoxy-1,4-benzoquinol methylase
VARARDRLRDARPRIVERRRSLVQSPTSNGGGSAAADEVEVVDSLPRLDEKLRLVDEAYQVSDDAMRAVFRSFRLELPSFSDLDPWSDAYREQQFELYRHLSARGEYRSEHETSGYEVDSRIPFPYYTKSAETVSNQLLAIGFMVKVMALPAGASVLEYGAGWGNTTITLARMGYDVHAIDIDETFVRMIESRAARLGLEIRAETGQFLDVSQLHGQYDAVLFYECFHHCSDHLRLLDELHGVVKSGGKVVLAAEPIEEAFHAPWGLRLDGESLWAIRRNGWLELGFKESYFIEACLRTGWAVAKHVTDVTPLGTIFVLSSTRGRAVAPGALLLPPADDVGWALRDSPDATERYSLERSRLVVETGRPAGEVVVDLVNRAPHALHVRIEHGAERWESDVPAGSSTSARLAYQPDSGEVFIGAPTWVPATSIRGSTDSRSIGIGVRAVRVP